MNAVRALDTIRGTKYADEGLPKDPLKAVELIARVVRGRLATGTTEQKRIAVVFKYAETIFPEGEGVIEQRRRPRCLDRADRAGLRPGGARQRRHAGAGLRERVDAVAARCSPSLTARCSRMPLPDEASREAYIKRVNATAELDLTSDVIDVLKKHTAGLTLVQIRALLQEAKLGKVDFGRPDYIYRRKREMIETECRGLLEFIQPRYKLDMVAVHTPRRGGAEARRAAGAQGPPRRRADGLSRSPAPRARARAS